MRPGGMWMVQWVLVRPSHWGDKGRHQNTQQRITKEDKRLLPSLQNLAFFYKKTLKCIGNNVQLDVITQGDL